MGFNIEFITIQCGNIRVWCFANIEKGTDAELPSFILAKEMYFEIRFTFYKIYIPNTNL